MLTEIMSAKSNPAYLQRHYISSKIVKTTLELSDTAEQGV
jgi:hypothetical protein